MKGTPFMYADDLAIVYEESTCKNLERIMQNDMKLIQHFMEQHKLSVNVEKTKVIIFKGKASDYLDITYDNKCIELVRNYKYLGVYLDENLVWDTQIQAQVKKGRRIAGIFKLIGKRIPKKLKKSIYYSMFHSIISYNIQIWGNTYNKYMKELQTVQNKAIKNLFCYDYRTSTAVIHKENEIMPLNIFIKYKLVTQVHMMVTETINTNTNFIRNNNLHRYNTRTAHNIRITSSNIRFNNQDTIYNAAYQLYNQIPLNIKNIVKISRFKQEVKLLYYNQI